MKKIAWVLAALLLVTLALPVCADEQGSFRFDHYQGGAMGMQMIDVTVDADAGVMSLWPVTDVTNVVVERLQWDDYAAATEVFRADTLSPNQVVNLRAYLTDVMPAFRVTCTNAAGQTERWYLADSGEDGSLLLLSRQSIEDIMPDIYTELAGIPFIFSSGAGAWSTVLTMTDDGSFTGEFHDSEMGEASDAYPNGTEYGCLFHGRLSYAGVTADNAYTLRIDLLENDEGQLPELIADGIHYVTTAPYGLEDADTLTLYKPGFPISRLPEGLLPWLHLDDMRGDSETLQVYALYNAADECGFVGVPPISEAE